MQEKDDKKIEQMVSDMMLDIGMPAHLKGYRYVRSAVLMAEEDMKVVGSVTKLLYPEIAKQYNTTDGKVERAIRNAIEISWERGNKKTFEGLFGYCCENGKARPTNSEYIAVIADNIRIQLNSENKEKGREHKFGSKFSNSLSVTVPQAELVVCGKE